MVREVQFYRSANRRSPVEEFLDSLESQHARKAAWVLRLIQDLDRIPKTYFKKLQGAEEIWEIRAVSSGQSIRFLAFYSGPKIVVLAHGFMKKSQRVPKQLIRLAEERRSDYRKRFQDE